MSQAPVLIPPLPQHALDEAKLFAFLADHLDGFSQPAELKQFQGGQSNPTYLITTPDRRFVLRKKPPGKLLPSAHQVEREYRVMDALRSTDAPVPNVRLLCEDETIAGTPFYVMDFVEGRVFTDTSLKDEPKASRKPIYRSLAETLAALHRVDYRAVGLSDFGKPENYVGRQIDRWARQYQAAKTEDIPAMDALTAWLPAHAPARDETTIAHGDFRLGNMIYATGEDRVTAILDWELATLGHPLSDLAYAALPFRLPPGGPMPGLLGCDFATEQMMTEQEFLETYARAVGRDDIPDFTFFLALSLFRLAGIAQGVYARSLAGNAADRSAARLGDVAKGAATLGWAIAQGG